MCDGPSGRGDPASWRCEWPSSQSPRGRKSASGSTDPAGRIGPDVRPRRASFPDVAVDAREVGGLVGGDKVNGRSSGRRGCMTQRGRMEDAVPEQGGEPILAASKTGPGEVLRLHGMRRSPALVVIRARPGQGWIGYAKGEGRPSNPLVGVVVTGSVHGEGSHPSSHISVEATPRPLNPLASSPPSRRLHMRQRTARGDGGTEISRQAPSTALLSLVGDDEPPPLSTI
ncbi:hypothetical protein B0T18DRAFT_406415 [Schizothecium vesticola]|uniref:Uncharacterized protein n=1 Tax=Schizothecium vesticola TaxID=314040 RepID=A0AA40F1B1_9PEZI|nr:hypothetical protein B0T18DRAFT_406415 [Schizothecium vesticola]